MPPTRPDDAGTAAYDHDPTPDPVRVVLVGAGGMGHAWLRTIAEQTAAELIGLVDLDTDRAAAALQETGSPVVPVAATLDDLDAAVVERADAVINVTVPAAHLPVTVAALRHGLAVLCEKPLSESTAEALRIAAWARVAGRLVMVSQSRRYWRAVTALRGQLAELGGADLASCEFLRGPRFGGFREEMADPLLMDMAIHQFDLARLLLGADPVSVTAESWNPDWSWFDGDACATATFRFADGARFCYTGSWVAAGVETSWNGAWTLSGVGGSAVWNGDDAPVARRADGTDVPGELDDGPEQIAGSLAEFCAALRGGPTPMGEVADNVISVAMVSAAVESARTGTRVELADLLARARDEALATEPDERVRQALAADA